MDGTANGYKLKPATTHTPSLIMLPTYSCLTSYCICSMHTIVIWYATCMLLEARKNKYLHGKKGKESQTFQPMLNLAYGRNSQYQVGKKTKCFHLSRENKQQPSRQTVCLLSHNTTKLCVYVLPEHNDHSCYLHPAKG